MKALIWIALLAMVSCNKSDIDSRRSVEFFKTVQAFDCAAQERHYIEAYLDSVSYQDQSSSSLALLAAIQQWTLERDYGCAFLQSNTLLQQAYLAQEQMDPLLDAVKARAHFYFERRVFDSAYFYYSNGVNAMLQLEQDESIPEFLYPMAIIDYYSDNIDQAEYAALKVLQYKIDSKSTDLFEVYSLLGNIKTQQRRYSEAAAYHDDASLHLNKDRYVLERATYLNNIGNVFEQIDELDEALCFYDEALKFGKSLQDEPVLYATLSSNSALARLRLGKLNLCQTINTLKVWDDLRFPSVAAYRQKQLARYFLKSGDTIRAVQTATLALERVDSLQNYVQMKALLRFLIPLVPDAQFGQMQKYLSKLASLEEGSRIDSRSFAQLKMEHEIIVAERERDREDFSYLGTVASGVVFSTLVLHTFNIRSARRRIEKAKRKQSKVKKAFRRLAADVNDMIDFARYDEKERIARDLHDDVMNQLAAARMQMSGVAMSIDPRNHLRFNEHLEKFQDVERQIRSIAHHLVLQNQSPKQPAALSHTVQNFIEEQCLLHEMYINCEIDEEFHTLMLSDKIKVNTFNIIKEAFFNSVKYSKGTQIVVRLLCRGSKLKVIIADDGIGISDTVKRGMGLRNMAQRASEMGARLTIKQTEPQGTSIELKLKLVKFLNY